MADIFSVEKRSDIMSRIRSAGTSPENRLYLMLRECLGSRRRIDRNVRDLPGQPDFLIPSLRLVVFADGCFYHGCPTHGHTPKSNTAYWIPKLARNRKRDAANRKALRAMGFTVFRAWEHDLKAKRLERFRAALGKCVEEIKTGDKLRT
jgi:DNA mismatch endonuclease (patch repair protein)